MMWAYHDAKLSRVALHEMKGLWGFQMTYHLSPAGVMEGELLHCH